MKRFLQRYKVLVVVFLGILFLPLSVQTITFDNSDCLKTAQDLRDQKRPFNRVAIFAVSKYGSVDDNQNPDSQDTVVKCVFSYNKNYATWQEFGAVEWGDMVIPESSNAKNMNVWTEIYIVNGFSDKQSFSVSHGNQKYSHYYLRFKNGEGIKQNNNPLFTAYFYFDELGYYKKSGDIETGEFSGRKRYVVKRGGTVLPQLNYAYIYFMGFQDDITYDEKDKKEDKSSYLDKYKKPDGYEGPLPECAFDGSCADVNKLLELVINIGKWFFSIIGSLAFVFFVYGGFTMILSFGSAEKFKKGQQVLVAAVIGMIIAFGAYALVNFLLTSLGVSDSFIFVK